VSQSTELHSAREPRVTAEADAIHMFHTELVEQKCLEI